MSEANHHLAGALVLLAGLLLIASHRSGHRWAWFRLVWPACFLACGVFLLVYSDAELWPFGRESWWYGLTHNLEDLQHKGFAVILLALGIVELQRARGRLRSRWAMWAFPVLALIGAAMLPFHEHEPDMSRMGEMGDMGLVQSEHIGFAITGVAIAIIKGLSELQTRWRRIFLRSWPVGLIVLGVQLLSYAEPETHVSGVRSVPSSAIDVARQISTATATQYSAINPAPPRTARPILRSTAFPLE